MNITQFSLLSTPRGSARLVLDLDVPVGELSGIYQKYKEGKLLKVDIKPVTKKRSLDQNALLWHTVGVISQALVCNKQDVYEEILRKYGVFLPMRIKKTALKDIKDLFGYIEVKEEREDDTMFILAYKGISQMDSVEASRVIDGALSDAEEMGLANDYGD